jgi:hypothetical protein
MLSRALSLATVTLLIGGLAAIPARAQQNLDAGKSAAQIFDDTCSACHSKGPRGLLRTMSAGSLPGFLREHYTTSSNMASSLSAFLISNGAASGQSKQGKDAKLDAKPAAPSDQVDGQGRRLRPATPSPETARPNAAPRQAARPDTDGPSPQAEPGRQGRNAKRLARPGEPPEPGKPAIEGQPPAQAAIERGPDGRRLTAKQRLSKRGKPDSEELPKADDAARPDAAKDEPQKNEPAKDDKPNSEAAKDEGNKPSGEGNPEATKTDPPKQTGEAPPLRADPVPPVTPAPPAAPVTSAAASGAPPEPAPAPMTPAPPPEPPAVTASAPQPVPAAPTELPAPPISQ